MAQFSKILPHLYRFVGLFISRKQIFRAVNEEICGKAFQKYGSNSFLPLYPDEVSYISFCGVCGCDENPFHPNVFQAKYRKWLCDVVVVLTIGLCGETPQATWITK